MTLQICEAGPQDEQCWEQFVGEHPDATFFHRYPWSRVLQRSFSHRPHFLLARRDGAVTGVLPLAEVRSLLFGRRLSSLPFAVYGGVLASDEASARALREHACELVRDLSTGTLELRNRDAASGEWPVKDLYVTFRKTLTPDHAANLKAIPNRQRAMLRKALKEGLYSEETDEVDRLYRVYSESVRNLGTPVFSRRYLRILKEEFGDDCRCMMIRQTADGSAVGGTDDEALCSGVSGSGGEDVAGVLSFYFRGEVLPYYGGSISRARSIKGCNHILYWELMRRSVNEGVLGFDFGRSKLGTGPYSFKKNLGFEATPLPYEYYLLGDAELPDLNPNNPRYERLINIWKRLPLPVANALGPLVAGALG